MKTLCGEYLNLAHYFPYDVKLRILAHTGSFLANQKARNAIVGAKNLLNSVNINFEAGLFSLIKFSSLPRFRILESLLRLITIMQEDRKRPRWKFLAFSLDSIMSLSRKPST